MEQDEYGYIIPTDEERETVSNAELAHVRMSQAVDMVVSPAMLGAGAGVMGGLSLLLGKRSFRSMHSSIKKAMNSASSLASKSAKNGTP